mmetsp:Transcript_12922/g.30707  ORF Transcript_12922/g.30707 Transcript_12922/m.30707 type:complete len:240 (-) Transcript_12922:448-1167(-)
MIRRLLQHQALELLHAHVALLRRGEGPAALGPLLRGHLITSDVDVRRLCKELRHLAEHVLGEVHRDLAGGQGVLQRPEACGHLRVPVLADVGIAQLRVRSDGRLRVARQVELRHHLDVQRLCEAQDVLDLLYGVGVVVGYFIQLLGLMALLRGAAVCAQPNELRELVHREAPALVVRQVPVEVVQLEEGHGPQQMLHLRGLEEVPAHVQHKASPFQGGGIFDLGERQHPAALAFLQHLA